MLTLIFILAFFLCFTIVVFFTKSSKTEVAVQRRLAKISEEHRATPAETTILKQFKLSPNPWMHDLLERLPVSAPVLSLIRQAGVEWWVSSFIFYSLLSAFIGGLIASIEVGSTLLILLAGIAASLLPAAYLFFLRYRKLPECDALLPHAVELMARALRAGHALNAVIEMVSQDISEPLASEFRIVHEEQAFGLPMKDALTNLLERNPRDDMRFLTTALLLQREVGGNLVQILDTTSHVMRERVRIRGQIKIYTAQARVSGWAVSLLPLVMFALLNLINPGYERILLDDPIGRGVLYFGLFMMVIGILIVKKIITIKV